MPTKLLPRKAEDPKYGAPLPKVELEPHDRKAEWRALQAEEILEPDLPIIDPHHHLWISTERLVPLPGADPWRRVHLAGSRGERTITKEKSV